MRLYRTKNRINISLVTVLIVFAAVVFLFISGVTDVSKTSDEQSMQQLQQSIEAAAKNCYAVEGFYPAGVSYLEEHYGIDIDDSKYVVLYELLGSNIAPYVKVIKVGSGGVLDEIQ